MYLVEKSSSDEEEMTERYYDALSPEEMNKLTVSDIRHESDDAERQVQEEEEETEEEYFDAYSHEELIRKKKTNNSLLTANLSKPNIGQELENGDCEESSADIWIPPDKRIGPYFNLRISESHEDSHISKLSVNGDYFTDFYTFFAKETNSEKGTTLSVEHQSENSENSSVAVRMFSDQRERESIDAQMSEIQSEMHNPECSSFGEQETFLVKQNPLDNDLTESQDDTDNPENSRSVVEEEEKYSNLRKAFEKLQIYRQVSKQPAEVEPKIGGRKQTGNKWNNYGRDLGPRNGANCRVFVSIEEYISPLSESKQILFTGNKLNNYGRDLGVVPTKADARYPRNGANCRVFVSIEEYISPLSESKQILFTKAKRQTGQCTKKARKQSGQSEKKVEIQNGQSEKKARKQIGHSEKKAKKQTGQSEKNAKKQTGQSEKKEEKLMGKSGKKSEKQTGQSVKVIYDRERREFGSSNKEKAVEKHLRQRNYNDYCPCHSFKSLKNILCVFLVVLHCPWVDGLGNGQQEHKAVFQHTLGTVSHCPNVSEHMKRASDKCAVACGSYFQTENCAYHCMRDSSKKSLVEFCVKPVILFDYCPVYDLIGQRIQKDFGTLCKPSKSFQRHYNSSDIFFCDPENCLQLQDAVGSTDLTGLVTENTPSNRGDINDTQSSQYWYMLLLLLPAVFAVLLFACIFRRRKNLSAWFGKITKKRNSNGSEEKMENRVFIR